MKCPRCNGKIIKNKEGYWCCRGCDLVLVEQTKSLVLKLKAEVKDLKGCLRILGYGIDKQLKKDGIITIEVDDNGRQDL